MSDPMMRPPDTQHSAPSTQDSPRGCTLFDQPRAVAAMTAAKSVGKRHAQILQLLADRPRTLWECAQALGVHDHQISGRITELLAAGQIEPTGEQRKKPDTNCPAAVYQIRRVGLGPPLDLGDALGHPDTLTIAGEEGTWERQPTLAQEKWPGIAYSRRHKELPRLTYRVLLIRCPLCAEPLKLIQTTPKKLFRCGSNDCNHTWEGTLIHEPGQPQCLALLMRTL